jgi:hypothetical protein
MALGALATGSGAVATTASLSDTVESNSDIRVINPQDMELRAGVAFRDDGSVRETDGYGPTETAADYNYTANYTTNKTFFEADDPNNPEGLEKISESDVPVATVNRRDENVDDEVVIQTAIALANYDGNEFWFENILEVENRAGGEQDLAIRYEDNYGADVNKDPGNVPELQQKLYREDVHQVYQFWVKKSGADYHISPEAGDYSEEPEEFVSLDPGETVQLDLKIDLGTYTENAFGNTVDPKKGIRNAQESLGFTAGLDTVDMLDAIKIGKYTT